MSINILQKLKIQYKINSHRRKFYFFEIILGILGTPDSRHLVVSILFITFMDDFE
jgi:hypothetical protein